MYTCKDSISLLMDYLDGELTPEDAQHLKEHLQGCTPCVDFLRTYRATPGVCKKALAHKMPQEMSTKLTEFLRAKCNKSTG
jgi:anti-sigma factor RsiW